MFSGHDHVYERAEHNGLRYFVSGGGGAPLYPRRPQAEPDRRRGREEVRARAALPARHVTGNRIEVTAVRADGTTIETHAWTDGPRPRCTPPRQSRACQARRCTGDERGADDRRARRADLTRPAAGSLVWFAVGGIVLALGAAVVRRAHDAPVTALASRL